MVSQKIFLDILFHQYYKHAEKEFIINDFLFPNDHKFTTVPFLYTTCNLFRYVALFFSGLFA